MKPLLKIKLLDHQRTLFASEKPRQQNKKGILFIIFAKMSYFITNRIRQKQATEIVEFADFSGGKSQIED